MPLIPVGFELVHKCAPHLRIAYNPSIGLEGQGERKLHIFYLCYVIKWPILHKPLSSNIMNFA